MRWSAGVGFQPPLALPFSNLVETLVGILIGIVAGIGLLTVLGSGSKPSESKSITPGTGDDAELEREFQKLEALEKPSVAKKTARIQRVLGQLDEMSNARTDYRRRVQAGLVATRKTGPVNTMPPPSFRPLRSRTGGN